MVVLDLVLVRPVVMWRLRTWLAVDVLPICRIRGIRLVLGMGDGRQWRPSLCRHFRPRVHERHSMDPDDPDGDDGGDGDDGAYEADELHGMKTIVH